MDDKGSKRLRRLDCDAYTVNGATNVDEGRPPKHTVATLQRSQAGAGLRMEISHI